MRAVCVIIASFVVTEAFLSVPRIARSSLSLDAAAVVDSAKTARLNKIKERATGRYDLGSMLEETEGESYSSFEDADSEQVDPPRVGQTITGAIIEIDDNGALLEIGGKMSGYLPLKEASLLPVKDLTTMYQIGQEVTAEVIGTLKGMPVISLRPYQLNLAWEQIIAVRAADTTFEAKVTEVNRGGAVCDCFGLKAFLPGSHCVGTADESLIGSTIQVKFLDVDEAEGKLVISQKRAANELKPDLKRGEVVGATVTGLRPYGVFLEVDGGLAGLLHISQISSERIDNLERFFSIGQKVRVMVIDHDRASGRVALATKPLEQAPGEMLRDSAGVFERADTTAVKYHERVEAEKQARQGQLHPPTPHYYCYLIVYM